MITNKQMAFIKLHIETGGTQRDIAKQIDVAEETISRWKKDDEFVQYYNEAMWKTIKMASSKAYRTMMELLVAKSEMVRFQAAKDILDRAGFIHKDEEKESKQEKDIAEALRGLVINEADKETE